MSNLKAPLEGLKVIELGTHAAVPATSRCLADWGAEVIKIEGLNGDEWRLSGKNVVTPIQDNENPVFTLSNANKKFISLNLKASEGKEIFNKLIQGADIFISNVRMKALSKMELDYDSLKVLNPRLIYCHFSGFGYNGPDGEKPGFDKTSFWAKGGTLADWAFEGNAPINPTTAFGDFTVSSLMLAGVLAGLIGREKTGEGTMVSSSLFGCSIWYNGIGIIASQQLYRNELNRYPKNVMRPLLPFSHFYRCKDGEWIMVTIIDHDSNYEKMCRILGMEEYIQDERFRTLIKAKQNIQEFVGILNERFMTKTSEEWLRLMGENNIVCQKLMHMKDVSADQQAWENDYLTNVKFSSGTTAVMPKIPVHFSNFTVEQYKPTGEIGRDTEQILTELGYTGEQIAGFRQKEALR